MKTYESGIEGKYFHTFEGGSINKQGQVLRVSGDVCIVEYFSWIDGGRNGRKAISMADIAEGSYVFYSTADEMNDMYYGLHPENS